MPFGRLTLVVSRNHILDGDRYPFMGTHVWPTEKGSAKGSFSRQ